MAVRMLSETPRHRLPREAYLSADWFEREKQTLFGRNWAFAGIVSDFAEPGDFRVVNAGPYALIVVRDQDGRLRGFHNMCRHRGTELLEGCGNAGKTIVCPYHNWVYNLDGRLRGVPAQSDCFPDLDKASIRLKPAAVGVFRDLVFVHPEAEPAQSFETWIGDLDTVAWPHDLSSRNLQEAPETLIYELQCNWKIFVENVLDGYHLAYLHKKTLGGPVPHLNTWEVMGQNLIWWSTEREGMKHRIPQFVEEAMRGSMTPVVEGAATPGYVGLCVFFPTTMVLPNPWGISISTLEPIDAKTTLLNFRNWLPKSFMTLHDKAKDVPGYDPDSGLIKSSHWKVHPLDTGDFQTEDVWVCEKMQRAIESPAFEVGPLARGSGGEAAIDYFQQWVLDFLPPVRAEAAE